MYKTCINFSLFTFLFVKVVTSQSFKTNQVTVEEFETRIGIDSSSISAVVLERNVRVDVSNFVEVYERIKILDKSGFDYATIDFPFYNAHKIKGFTHNLINGEIVSSELKKDMIFTENVERYGRNLRDQKAVFPKVSEGSILEIYYKSKTGTFADILLQYDIPIKKLYVQIENSSMSNFSVVQNPEAIFNIESIRKRGKVLVSLNDIPPLYNEKYVFDMEKYRAKLILKKTGSVFSKYSIKKWGDFPKILSEIKEFTQNLKPIYKEEIRQLVVQGKNNPMKVCQLVYEYLQDNIDWDNKIGIFPSNKNEITFEEKKGNVADINMLLQSLLKSMGISAFPILASSKMNGIQLNPSQESFDYLLVGVNINDKWYILDAANPEATFDYIPQFMLNWKGMILKPEKQYDWINLLNSNISRRTLLGTVNLENTLNATGLIKERRTGYFGIHLNKLIKGEKIDKDNLLESPSVGLTLSNTDIIKNKSKANSELFYEFSFEDVIEEVGDKLHLRPLLFLAAEENPFKSDERQIPIDFGFRKSTQYILTFNIPEEIKVVNIPKSLNLLMPDELGSYQFSVMVSGNQIKVSTKYEINDALISPHYYEALKNFLNAKVEKEKEMVIFERI